MKSRARMFRKLLDGDKLFMRPCAYDALSAVLIEQAGFRVMGTTGYGIAASLIGQPDIGLVGYAEMLERSRTIINAVKLPVDVDVDTGYGNAMNVYWTVQNFARIGAAGVRIEDQDWPKRCGHMAGKSIISTDEMIGKIRASVKARDEEDVNMVIGARTDARSILSFKETVKRATAYAEAGVDYVYVEAPQSLEEVDELVKQVYAPVAFNIIPGGKTPPFKIEDLEARGVRYLSVPMICLYPAAKAMQEALSELKTSQDLNRITEMGVNWTKFNEIVGHTTWRRLELETLSSSELNAKYGTSDLAEIKRRETEAGMKWLNK
jgi:2-methylisocitrate lyase-like PEP mutase family enzyme